MTEKVRRRISSFLLIVFSSIVEVVASVVMIAAVWFDVSWGADNMRLFETVVLVIDLLGLAGTVIGILRLNEELPKKNN